MKSSAAEPMMNEAIPVLLQDLQSGVLLHQDTDNLDRPCASRHCLQICGAAIPSATACSLIMNCCCCSIAPSDGRCGDTIEEDVLQIVYPLLDLLIQTLLFLLLICRTEQLCFSRYISFHILNSTLPALDFEHLSLHNLETCLCPC